MKRRALLMIIAPLAAGSPVHADDAGLRACRKLPDAERRLACYDALPLTAAPSTAAPIQAAGAGGATPTSAQAIAQFGMEARTRVEGPAAIDSSIAGRFEGWEPRARLRLANGQVWQIADDSSAAIYKMDPKVRVRRGALGAFYLEIEGTNRSPRVVRVE